MIELRPIEPSEGADALAVAEACFRELWGLSVADIRATYDPLDDYDEPASYYPARDGAFFVLADGGKVVGTGGITRLGPDAAEMRRLWLLAAYRGRGLGRRLVEGLLVFARYRDYRRVCLEVATPELQQTAVAMYRRLGFRPIAPYREGATSYAMERKL
jgi:ribosomal protein S18 acetylase RimI-like enzyme